MSGGVELSCLVWALLSQGSATGGWLFSRLALAQLACLRRQIILTSVGHEAQAVGAACRLQRLILEELEDGDGGNSLSMDAMVAATHDSARA